MQEGVYWPIGQAFKVPIVSAIIEIYMGTTWEEGHIHHTTLKKDILENMILETYF